MEASSHPRAQRDGNPFSIGGGDDSDASGEELALAPGPQHDEVIAASSADNGVGVQGLAAFDAPVPADPETKKPPAHTAPQALRMRHTADDDDDDDPLSLDTRGSPVRAPLPTASSSSILHPHRNGSPNASGGLMALCPGCSKRGCCIGALLLLALAVGLSLIAEHGLEKGDTRQRGDGGDGDAAASQYFVSGDNGVVAATNKLAAEAGLQALKDGGNAFDAAGGVAEFDGMWWGPSRGSGLEAC